MKRAFGILMIWVLLLMSACATASKPKKPEDNPALNYQQAGKEGAVGAVIGAIAGGVVGGILGGPGRVLQGIEVGMAIGVGSGIEHGLFNRDEEMIAMEQRTQDALALSNRALTKVLKNQGTGGKAAAQKSAATKKSAVGVPSRSCAETEVFNASKFEIVAKLGGDPVGKVIPSKQSECFSAGYVFAMKTVNPVSPNDWVVKTPDPTKKVIYKDADFKKK